MNIGFIGLGKLGLDCAEVLAEKHNVRGYDVEPRTSHSVAVTTLLRIQLINQIGCLLQYPLHIKKDMMDQYHQVIWNLRTLVMNMYMMPLTTSTDTLKKAKKLC